MERGLGLSQRRERRLKAFVSGSERQAANSSFLFLSPERDVYFDGQGPLRAFRMD
jgi:hypothetical protein